MASERGSAAVPQMKLKIISNSEEVGTHMFDNIPVDTTVGWIKTHLQATLPSCPSPESQRILYQARFLDDDNATLASIFGNPTPDERAFHLVLRAPRGSRQNMEHFEPRTASAPPDPARIPVPAAGNMNGDHAERAGSAAGANAGQARIELSFSDFQQMQQAIDQAQTQLYRSGYGPGVGHTPVVQGSTYAHTSATPGVLDDAGLHGANVSDPGRQHLQQAEGAPAGRQASGTHHHEDGVPHTGHSIQITQSFSGMPLHQYPADQGHLALHANITQQHQQQHLQAHRRALEILQQQRRGRDEQQPPANQPHHQQPLDPSAARLPSRTPTLNAQAAQAAPPLGHGPNVFGGVPPGGFGARGINPETPFPHFPQVPVVHHVQQQHFGGFFPPQVPFMGPFAPNVRGGFPAAAYARGPVHPNTQPNIGSAPSDADVETASSSLQDIQRQLDDIQRRAQDLSSQRQAVLGQTTSSIRQDEVRSGFRSVVETLQRLQTDLDILASEPSARHQSGFVSLRTLVDDLLLQSRMAELEVSRSIGSRSSNHVSGAAALGHQSTVTAAFPSSAANSTSVTSQNVAAPGPSRNMMLLRDPAGQPHALLVGPTGAYRTPEIPQDLLQSLFQTSRQPVDRNDTFSRFVSQTLGNRQPVQAQVPVNGVPLQQALLARLQAAAAQANGPQQGPMARDERANQQDPAQPRNGNGAANANNGRQNLNDLRDAFRNVMGPIWLAIQTATMIYFFGGVSGGSNGWFHWRPYLIAFLMFTGWLVQRPWARRRIDAVRVHFEQLFGVQLHVGAGGGIRADAVRPAAPPQEGQAAARPEHTQVDRSGAPAAAQTAGSVAQHRQQGVGDRRNLREQLRGVERAVALFAASLVPGMGEGIVQARQTAEADARRAIEEAERASEEQAAAAERSEAEQTASTEAAPVAAPGAVGASESEDTSVQASGATAESSQVDIRNSDGGAVIRRVNKSDETTPSAGGSEASGAGQGSI